MSPSSGAHIAPLTLHQLRLGELDADTLSAVRSHVDGCEACRRRLQQQQAERRAFELEPVPQAIRDAARTPAVQPWWRRAVQTPWAMGAMAAAAALAVVVVLPSGLWTDPVLGDQIHEAADPAQTDTVRTKGTKELELLVEGRGYVSPDTPLAPGDRIQLRTPSGPWTEAWVGDGESVLGRFTLVPDQANLSPFSLTMDGAPGDEDLVVLLARSPLGEPEAAALLDLVPAQGADAQGMTPPGRSDVRIHRFTLQKVR